MPLNVSGRAIVKKIIKIVLPVTSAIFLGGCAGDLVGFPGARAPNTPPMSERELADAPGETVSPPRLTRSPVRVPCGTATITADGIARFFVECDE